MTAYEDLRKEILSTPEVKKEYDALGPVFDVIQMQNPDAAVGEAGEKPCSNRSVETERNHAEIG